MLLLLRIMAVLPECKHAPCTLLEAELFLVELCLSALTQPFHYQKAHFRLLVLICEIMQAQHALRNISDLPFHI